MADVYLDMSGEDESGEKCGQEIQKRRFPTYPGEASQSMEGPYLSGKMVEMEAPGVGKRNRTAGINPAGDELQSAAMASKTSLNTHISFGSVSLSGRAREMEDAISVQPGFVQFQDACTPFHFFAVFDGHGGSHVSALCKEMMHSVLAEEIMAEPARGVSSGAEETRWKSAVERCFRRMDRLALSACACGRVGEPTCTCERSGIESDVVGSTAVIAVVGGGRLLIANCGDSRAVLSRGGRTVPLSVDHKPDRPDELARIEAAGGRVIYVNGARVHGILAMSRALVLRDMQEGYDKLPNL